MNNQHLHNGFLVGGGGGGGEAMVLMWDQQVCFKYFCTIFVERIKKSFVPVVTEAPSAEAIGRLGLAFVVFTTAVILFLDIFFLINLRNRQSKQNKCKLAHRRRNIRCDKR